ncbi:MAG: ribosomal-processing cysteine protease Prp [Oscillospiraceae bacterium]|nr:ribosomal-processing cysteine protease Prp [Oscillospiraceae bacterium]
MIKIEFYQKGKELIGFTIRGHSGYAQRGQDIVCAGVSSATELVINTIINSFDKNTKIRMGENSVYFLLGKETKSACALLKSYYLHIKGIAEEYKDTVRINVCKNWIGKDGIEI